MIIGQKYKPKLLDDDFDAIVIGSGIGGLATAAFLAKTGKKVLVLERHYTAGGFTHSYTRKGYEWDVGLHYIGQVHKKKGILRRIFDDISEEQLQWAKMSDVYDTIIFGEDRYEFVAGTQRFKERLKEYFPEEKSAIDRYIDLVFEVNRASRNFFGRRAMAPWMGNLFYSFMSKKFLKYAQRTTKEVLSELTKNPKLIAVLTGQYGDYGLPPSLSSFGIHAMVAHHYFDGGNYPVGGASNIARTILPVIEKAGGKVLVSAEVASVLVENNSAIGVKLKDESEVKAPIIISNAGVYTTFNTFFDPEVGKKFLSKFDYIKPSTSHICLYIGCKHSASELALEQSNLWIYPDYDHDLAVKKYLDHPSAPLPVTYISFPSSKDPDWENRYPGKSTIEVIGLAPYEWFERWEDTKWRKRGEEYSNWKEKLSERLFEQLYRYVPNLKDKVDYHELSTPLSTKHFSNYQYGEIYGLEHTPERFLSKDLTPHTPVKNFYLTGQDIVTDGIGGALFSGVITTSAILKRNILKDILKRT